MLKIFKICCYGCYGEETTSSETSSFTQTSPRSIKINFQLSRESYELDIPVPTINETINLLDDEFTSGDTFHEESLAFFLFFSMVKKSIKENKKIVDKKNALRNLCMITKECWSDILDRRYTDEYEALASNKEIVNKYQQIIQVLKSRDPNRISTTT